jgi:hypothetical protein
VRPHPSPDVQKLLALFHPNWVQALQQAVRTKGQEGYSTKFSCLTVCPSCGQALRADIQERRVEYLTDEPTEVYDFEYELYCPSCGDPTRKLSDALEDYFTLEMLNQDLLGDWLEDWLPSQELMEACLTGDRLALLFLHIVGEALDGRLIRPQPTA